MTASRAKSNARAEIRTRTPQEERGFKAPATAPTAPIAGREITSPPRDATIHATALAKHCPRCGETKPLSDFNTRTKHGKAVPQPYCKPCFLAYWHEWYHTKGRATFGAATNRYRTKYPERHAARNAVAAALRSGRLVRGPCAARADGRCTGQIQAHHPDYSKRLDVVWLCRTHHIEADQALGIGKRGRPRKAVA